MLTAELLLNEISTPSDTRVDYDSMADIVQNSVIEGINECKESYKNESDDFVTIWEDQEGGRSLCIYKGVKHFFLGIERGNLREYISCSKKRQDLCYTVETLDNSIKVMRYTYDNAPRTVLENSLRILSLFESYFRN